jgi:hypothetical protein
MLLPELQGEFAILFSFYLVKSHELSFFLITSYKILRAYSLNEMLNLLQKFSSCM